MDNADRVRWLQTNTALGSLSEEVLGAIAAAVEEQSLSANQCLSLEDRQPQALYILKAGRLECDRINRSSASTPRSLLPGALLHLKELLLDQAIEQTVISLSDGVVWAIPREAFLALAQQYPEISRPFSQQLALDLAQISSQLNFEKERQIALRPYLVPRVRRGIVGSSRYAKRLRQEIHDAADDRQSVLIFGEPGLGKDNAAALIHFGSDYRREPIIKVNCETLQDSGADLFGRAGGKPGLLGWLGQGTLVLNNIQDLPKALEGKFCQLLSTGDYSPVTREDSPPAPARPCEARIIITSEKNLPQLPCNKLVGRTIKVPPLRVRKADIAAQANYFLSLICRQRSIAKPRFTPEAIRSLQSYDFPGNSSELESLIERAVVQSEGAAEITEEVLWAVSSKAKRFRVNLLNVYPWLRQFLRSDWWPDRINYGFTLVLFAVVVALLLWGPQTRDRNIALNVFWAWWWPLVLLGYLFVGRLWCAVCPFMIYGELVQKISLKLYPRQLQSWPRQEAERWGGWFLFALFALIFLWEELWNLENVAYLSGCLLLLITLGAIVFSLLFERRFWCRYLCPIGGMNGLFAKLSMVELRAQQGICSATCTTYQCYKGGSAKGEGQETGGCPIYSHPAQLKENRDCVLCMTCLKACPHRSVELNLRPPGIELWTSHTPTAREVALLFLLFGGIGLHRLPELEQWLGWSLHLNQFGYHAIASILILLLPVAIALLAHAIIRWLSPRPNPPAFIKLAYGYLPLILGGSLAHYLRLGLNEAGRAIPVTLATLGYSGVSAPVAVADPAVLAFLQGVTLIVSVWLSIFLTQQIARQPWWSLLPQHVATFALGSFFWKLIVGW